MNQGDGFWTKRRLVAIAISLFVLLTFGCLALTYVLAAFHIQYLPTPAYIESVKYYAMASAALCAMIGFSLVVNLPFDEKKESGLGHLLGILLLLVLFAIIGHQLVTTTIPLCAALLSGEKVHVAYTVTFPEYIGGKFCKTAIGLAGMPTLDETLCNFPPDFQQQLKSGSEIIVTGRGTHMGLFVESARLAEPAVRP